MKAIVRLPTSRFVRIACRKCRNEQIVFSKAATVIRCQKCGEILAEPTGGLARIKGKVLSILS